MFRYSIIYICTIALQNIIYSNQVTDSFKSYIGEPEHATNMAAADLAAVDAQVAAKFQELVDASGLADPPAIGAVSIKLPPFWTTRPEVWFAQCEAQFVTRNITSQLTKFYYVVAALDTSTAAEVESLILNPPVAHPYDQLKADLIKAFGRTQEDKDMALLNLTGLGDRKPSALLRYMSSLNSNPATLFRALFLMQLPVEVRRVLAINTTASMTELADEADRIMAASKLSTTIGAITSNVTYTPPPVDNVAAVSVHRRSTPDSLRDTAHSATRRRALRSLAEAGLDANGICAYHVRFNADAVRCLPGCRYARHVAAPPTLGNANADRR